MLAWYRRQKHLHQTAKAKQSAPAAFALALPPACQGNSIVKCLHICTSFWVCGLAKGTLHLLFALHFSGFDLGRGKARIQSLTRRKASGKGHETDKETRRQGWKKYVKQSILLRSFLMHVDEIQLLHKWILAFMETFRIFEKIWKVGSATPTDLTVLSTM